MLTVGFYSLPTDRVPTTTRRRTETYPPLTPGWWGAHDKFEAADLYRERIAIAKKSDAPMSGNYLRDMGKKAGFSERRIEEDIERLYRLRRPRENSQIRIPRL